MGVRAGQSIIYHVGDQPYIKHVKSGFDLCFLSHGSKLKPHWCSSCNGVEL